MNVVVIGAGVVGLVAAVELARRGAAVTVLERLRAGAGATEKAAGMLAPVAEARFGEGSLTEISLESLRLWPAFAGQLERASGVEIDYRSEGTLVVAIDRDDLGSIAHVHTLHRDLGLPAQMLDGASARELEPHLAPSIPGAVYCPEDHQVDPPKLIAALVSALRAAGGELREGVEVRGFVTDDERVVGIDCDGFEAPPDATWVVAVGAWLRRLEGLGPDAPHVRPVRGQMLAVELGDPPMTRHVIRAPDAYLVPKSDGRLLIGATMEERGFDDRQTAGGIMDLLVGAWETIPAIHDAAILDMWTGFRPMSLDSEPVMRRSDRFANVVYAAGHGRNGILLAPYTARRVAELVVGSR